MITFFKLQPQLFDYYLAPTNAFIRTLVVVSIGWIFKQYRHTARDFFRFFRTSSGSPYVYIMGSCPTGGEALLERPPFSGLMCTKGWRKLSFWSVKRHKRANRCV